MKQLMSINNLCGGWFESAQGCRYLRIIPAIVRPGDYRPIAINAEWLACPIGVRVSVNRKCGKTGLMEVRGNI